MKQNLPLQIEAAKQLEDFEIVICYAHKKLLPEIEAIAPGVSYMSSKWRYELMKHAKVALATSGTIVL